VPGDGGVGNAIWFLHFLDKWFYPLRRQKKKDPEGSKV